MVTGAEKVNFIFHIYIYTFKVNFNEYSSKHIATQNIVNVSHTESLSCKKI